MRPWRRRRQKLLKHAGRKAVALHRAMAELYNVPISLGPEARDLVVAAAGDAERILASFMPFFPEAAPDELSAGGVRVIPIRGTLFRGFFFDDYDLIRSEVDQAVEDEAVRAILLDVDSPGGKTAGLFDLVDHLHGIRGRKPIWALANDQATSAAYAIASAADRVLTTRTGLLGSIGVVAIHVDESKRNEREGIRVTEIASGRHKTDLSRNRPLGPEGRRTLQSLVDTHAALLIEQVARNRGLSEKAVRD